MLLRNGNGTVFLWSGIMLLGSGTTKTKIYKNGKKISNDILLKILLRAVKEQDCALKEQDRDFKVWDRINSVAFVKRSLSLTLIYLGGGLVPLLRAD